MEPRWLTCARSFVGVKEDETAASNPTIMEWARRLGGWVASYYKDDDIPWCALFVNHCLSEAGLRGTGTLAARDFSKWGKALILPTPGAVLVFSRKGGGGHVGFYIAENAQNFQVLGGNQSNAVSYTWIPKSRLLAIRWPTGVPVPEMGTVTTMDSGPISSNEA